MLTISATEGVIPPPQKGCLGYDTKLHLVLSFHFKIASVDSLPLLPVPLSRWVIVPVRVLSVDPIELFENDLYLIWPSRPGLQDTPTAFLQRGKTPSTSVLIMTLNKSNGEAPVIQDFWVMRSTLSLPSLLDPPDRVLSKLCTYARLNCLK